MIFRSNFLSCIDLHKKKDRVRGVKSQMDKHNITTGNDVHEVNRIVRAELSKSDVIIVMRDVNITGNTMFTEAEDAGKKHFVTASLPTVSSKAKTDIETSNVTVKQDVLYSSPEDDTSIDAYLTWRQNRIKVSEFCSQKTKVNTNLLKVSKS